MALSPNRTRLAENPLTLVEEPAGKGRSGGFAGWVVLEAVSAAGSFVQYGPQIYFVGD